MKKFFALIALLLPVAVMAQEKADSVVAPQAQETTRLAAELSKYGYANNDAISLVQAARLAKQLGLTAVDLEKTSEGTPAEDNGTKSGKVSLDPAQLLADAAAMAQNDAVVAALIDDVNSNVRGAIPAEQYAVDRVNAHATDVYKIRFRGGETAIVTVVGDGDTDLDLYVYNSSGTLVDSDTDYSDNCVCIWTPRYTGTYTIKIVNRGSVYNRYVLATN